MDNKFERAGNSEQNNTKTGWEGVAALADDYQSDIPTSETVTQSETVSQPEKILTADNNVYREIAKDALMNWNGLSEEEAREKTSSLTEKELEENVGARSSIESAIYGIYDALAERELISKDYRLEKEELFDDILNSEKNSEAFRDLGEKLERVDDKEEFTLDVLSSIHNDWIRNNLEKLNDPNRVDKRYQFMPLEFIGIDEAKADLIFVKPIFEAAGMEIDEAKLGYKYARYKLHSNGSMKEELMSCAADYDYMKKEIMKGIFEYDQMKSLSDEVTASSGMRLGMRTESIIDGVSQCLTRLPRRSPRDNFKIDLSNVDAKNKPFAEFSKNDQHLMKTLYAAEIADQLCNKLA